MEKALANERLCNTPSTQVRELSAPTVDGLFPSPMPLAQVLDEIPVAVSVLSPKRKILSMNRACEALTGITREQAHNLPCRHVLRSSNCMQRCPLLDMDSHAMTVTIDGDIVNRDRRKLRVHCTMSPLLDGKGNLMGFLECIEDASPKDCDRERSPGDLIKGGLVGSCPSMDRLFRFMDSISQTDSSVLITGETGTGKDVLAEALHQGSSRSRGPFIKVNCGALPESLLESELFGHKKGAFTGAVENKPGRIRLAQGGTLFLTEIGDLPLLLQVKLLSFLDDKVVYPLGDSKGVPVDVRLMAATHRDLEQMVRNGLFRQDLLFRLNVVRVSVPPLRERNGDIRLLTERFLRQYAEAFNKEIKGLTISAQEVLDTYPFPGNVRELRNIIEYAVNVCDMDMIEPRHLPEYLFQAEPVHSAPLERETISLSQVSEERHPSLSGLPQADSWEAMERDLILQALANAKGRRGEAAKILGWSRSTLWRKIKHHGLA